MFIMPTGRSNDHAGARGEPAVRAWEFAGVVASDASGVNAGLHLTVNAGRHSAPDGGSGEGAALATVVTIY